MKFELPNLPYAKDALEPHISARTLEYHYEKHHRSYIEKLNKALEKTDIKDDNLLNLMTKAREAGEINLFNNAAQAWNHGFFWHSMSPDADGIKDQKLKKLVEDFGGIQRLRNAFIDTGSGQFGSGWVWLVVTNDQKLDVVSTPNAEPPQLHGMKPLLTCDLWEHAYYLDYQNERGRFLETFFDKLANWDFAALCLDGVGKDDDRVYKMAEAA